jgi:hypothetical protein
MARASAWLVPPVLATRTPAALSARGEPVEAGLVEHADEHAADRQQIDDGLCGWMGMRCWMSW